MFLDKVISFVILHFQIFILFHCFLYTVLKIKQVSKRHEKQLFLLNFKTLYPAQYKLSISMRKKFTAPRSAEELTISKSTSYCEQFVI